MYSLFKGGVCCYRQFLGVNHAIGNYMKSYVVLQMHLDMHRFSRKGGGR